MIDREKTSLGIIEMIMRDAWRDIDIDRLRYQRVLIDALALLKEQEEQIKNRDESLEKAREEIKWLWGMLKEQ